MNGNHYELAVYNGSPAGIACAVRAARQGLSVLVANHTPILGGMIANGLCVWDTQYEGKRSPIYDQLRQAMFDYYRETYGEDSPQYETCLPGPSGHSNGNFEPKVAQMLVEKMVAAESGIELLMRHYPTAAEIAERMVKSVTFAEMGEDGLPKEGGSRVVITADTWADCSYEGDRRIQAFNWRTMLTNVKGNVLPVEKPEGYNRNYIETLEKPGVMDYGAPNEKRRVNRPQLVGPQNAYVDGTWADRKKVMDDHWNALLGCLYFTRNDESEPEERRARERGWGLPKDEFSENAHRPYEMYVRESRRLEGRYVFTEHDATYIDDIARARVHSDAIAVTEWYIDIHACTFEKLLGTLHEGKIMLHQETFPGQIPYRAIVPKNLDNLLVPSCVSSSHVGWSTIRLEPTWMNIGEAAGWAVVIAGQKNIPVSEVNRKHLTQTIALNGVMVSFF